MLMYFRKTTKGLLMSGNNKGKQNGERIARISIDQLGKICNVCSFGGAHSELKIIDYCLSLCCTTIYAESSSGS